MSIKEIAERASLTFAEAALVIVTAAGTNIVDLALWKGAALAGAAAVLSLALNLVRAQRQKLA